MGSKKRDKASPRGCAGPGRQKLYKDVVREDRSTKGQRIVTRTEYWGPCPQCNRFH